jgi:hypothetical protein
VMPKTTSLLRRRRKKKLDASIAQSYSPLNAIDCCPCKNQAGGWHRSEPMIECGAPRVSSRRKKRCLCQTAGLRGAIAKHSGK